MNRPNFKTMWQEITEDTKNKLSNRIQNNVGISPVQAEDSVYLAGDSTRLILLEEARQGNIDQLIGLFRGDNEASSSHPIAHKIGRHLEPRLIEQLALDPEVARTVHHMTVPAILSNIKNKIAREGAAPSQQSLTALFGGTNGMTEGQRDKLRKGLDGSF